MDLTVYWTRFAENKLDDIFDYYETNVSNRTAQELVKGIIVTPLINISFFLSDFGKEITKSKYLAKSFNASKVLEFLYLIIISGISFFFAKDIYTKLNIIIHFSYNFTCFLFTLQIL